MLTGIAVANGVFLFYKSQCILINAFSPLPVVEGNEKMKSSEFPSVTSISMSVAKCLPVSSGVKARKRSHLADGGEWERSYPLHQTAGSSHSRSRTAAFWRQDGLLCFLGFWIFLTDTGLIASGTVWPVFFDAGFPRVSFSAW